MHIDSDIQKKIRRVEIYTRRLLSGSLVGSSRSALKGVGFEFDQIREYQIGDDIRFIDWRASARSQELLIKQYIEERSRTVYLIIDGSRSMLFGKDEQSKYERVAWIASILALIVMYGSDNVGCIIYTDVVEHHIPPSKGHKHVYAIMHMLFSYMPVKTKTNITVALKKLLELQNRRSLVFIVSDFIDDYLGEYIGHVAKKHDVIALRCLDLHECELPSVGFLTVQDQENGFFDSLDLNVHGASVARALLSSRMQEQQMLFKQCGVTCIDNRNSESFIADLLALFRRRMRY